MTGVPPARFGAAVAVCVAVAAALATGVALGAILPTAAAVGGALSVAGSARLLERTDAEAQAVASVGAVSGTTLLVVAVASGPGAPITATVLIAATAVLAAAVGGFVDLSNDSLARLTTVTGPSAAVVVAAFFVAAFVGTDAAPGFVSALGAVAAGAGSDSAFAWLVALQVEALLVLALLRVSIPILDEWLRPGDGPVGDSLDRLEAFGVAPVEVPENYWKLLGGQVVLAAVFPASLDRVLALLSVGGAAVRTLLVSGVVHAPLAFLLAVLVAIRVVEPVRRAAMGVVGPHPPQSVGRAAGGLAACVVVPLAAVGPTAGPVAAAVPGRTPTLRAWSVFGILALALVGLHVFDATALRVARSVRSRVVVFEASAVLLFAAAVLAGLRGAFGPFVFATGAAAFVVWDVGSNAVSLRAALGPDARTERGEFVRAAASVTVGVAASVVATVALYVLGPLSVSLPQWRARLALTLALAALLSFVAVLVTEE